MEKERCLFDLKCATQEAVTITAVSEQLCIQFVSENKERVFPRFRLLVNKLKEKQLIIARCYILRADAGSKRLYLFSGARSRCRLEAIDTPCGRLWTLYRRPSGDENLEFDSED